LLQSHSDKGTSEAAKAKKADENELSGAAGTIARTEAGDGMFGADIELESLTDSADENEELPREKKKVLKQTAEFKIVTGDDSDSIFEERLQQEAKFDDMEMSDYDDEDWKLDEYNDMNENAPEALPLEIILEENSQMLKDSPPQPTTDKLTRPSGPARPASGIKASFRSSNATAKRAKSPIKR